MSKPRILIQLDTDCQPSVFDAVVAVDSGVDHLFRHGGVTPDAVRELIYGAMFTRGPENLRNTAVFIGGSNAVGSEALLAEVTGCFFGPVRVSVMLDPNGANTTAAAAVHAASRHESLAGAEAVVLAATGPVGRRVVRLLAREGARVRAVSRSYARAQTVCNAVRAILPDSDLTPVEQSSSEDLPAILDHAVILIAAGTSGVQLVPETVRRGAMSLRVVIDLNAVPPAGIEGVAVHDTAEVRAGCICYGAIGVGDQKMKIHQAALHRLFETNDLVLDAEEIYAIAKEIG
ncbi:MAG: bifunctional NADP-dependent methylenetetrahydromethanopterin dehydrogenase/methylenetetrahydrofolate dehydrogenase [Pirellulales bacterium]|nr:bifunctional NADP-dependent methylenetetrahydromethanopterin dehydrogenase/methylenetetrahydrofolate dehydrogenase [Pirellulales bacterium]